MRTSEFLEDVKRHISVPTFQPRFTDLDVLKLASSELKTKIVAEISSLREEFFVVDKIMTVPATSGVIQIPARAIGRVVRDVWISTENSTNMDDFREITKIELEEVLRYRNGTVREGPYSWYFKGDKMYFHPPTSADTYAWLKYLQQPSELVSEDVCCTVVSYTDDTVTVDAVPDNIEVGSYCDITLVNPGFQIVVEDALVTNVGSTTITFSGYDATNPLSGFSAGDSVSLARQSSVIQIPEDWHDSLIWATCLTIAYSLGIPDMITQSKEQLEGAIKSARDACSPRAENSRPKIIDHNGLLRSRNYARKFPAVTI